MVKKLEKPFPEIERKLDIWKPRYRKPVKIGPKYIYTPEQLAAKEFYQLYC